MIIDKLAWIHIANRKLLATRTRGRDAWYIPGGKMTCYQGPYAGELKPCREIEEVAWLGYGDRARSSDATRLILDWLRDRHLIDN